MAHGPDREDVQGHMKHKSLFASRLDQISFSEDIHWTWLTCVIHQTLE